MGANVRRPERDSREDTDPVSATNATSRGRVFSWAESDSLPANARRLPGSPSAPLHVLGFELLK